MSHQRLLSSPPASALPDRYAEAVTTSSSAPSRAGAWDSHQRTSRISRLGSASGSQPGQYARATDGVSGMNSVTGLWRGYASPSPSTLVYPLPHAKLIEPPGPAPEPPQGRAQDLRLRARRVARALPRGGRVSVPDDLPLARPLHARADERREVVRPARRARQAHGRRGRPGGHRL